MAWCDFGSCLQLRGSAGFSPASISQPKLGLPVFVNNLQLKYIRIKLKCQVKFSTNAKTRPFTTESFLAMHAFQLSSYFNERNLITEKEI